MRIDLGKIFKVMAVGLGVLYTAVAFTLAGWLDTPAAQVSSSGASTITSINVSGAINTFAVVAPSGNAWTGTVAIATSLGETIFTTPTLTATTVFRPRPAVPVDSANAGLGTTNHYEMVVISNEKLTFTVTSTSAAAQDLKLKILLVNP